jgi:hypothetical protein
MKRRRVALLGGLAVLMLTVAVHAQTAPSDVANLDTVMWWSKRPGAQASTSAAGFEVANGVDGKESVAAFRILIHGSITKATLIGVEAPSQTTAISVPKLQVCPTDALWLKGPTPGDYSKAPAPNCSASAPFTRDDRGNWTADITGMMGTARSEVSVMVVPAEDKSLPVPPTFFVQFSSSRVSAEGTPDVAPAPPPPPVVAPPAVSRPSASPVPTVATPTPAVAPAATTPTTVAAQPVPIRLGGTAGPPKRHNDWGKLVWIIPLAALIAVSWTMSRKILAERGLIPASN